MRLVKKWRFKLLAVLYLVIAEIEEKYKDGNVLVVSHKATIWIILCSLLGID